MNNRNRLTAYILAGLVLGVVVGYIANGSLANPTGFADAMSLITTLFLRLIKMIIAPLVFSTLVVGIARMGDTREVGRIGIKALGWFVIASVISLGKNPGARQLTRMSLRTVHWAARSRVSPMIAALDAA